MKRYVTTTGCRRGSVSGPVRCSIRLTYEPRDTEWVTQTRAADQERGQRDRCVYLQKLNLINHKKQKEEASCKQLENKANQSEMEYATNKNNQSEAE